MSDRPTDAPDSIEIVPPAWLDEWREYAEGLEDTSLDFGDRETLMIHQDGFAGGWTAATERADDTLQTVHAELAKVKGRLVAVERERDEWGGKAATAQTESSVFRRQRDEVVEALSNLYVAVVTVTNADPTHYEVANAVGQPSLVALQLIERYRPKGATPT